MSQMNITSNMLSRLQQKIGSFNHASQPTQQSNPKITTDHVTSASEESSGKEEKNIEKKKDSMKKECYLDSESEDYATEKNAANPSSESYECSENCNPIPIIEYGNINVEESSDYDPELNEISWEPNIDKDKKFKEKFMGTKTFPETIEQQVDLKIGKGKKGKQVYCNGKQYGEDWKRNFVIDLLKSLSQLDEAKKNDYIRQVSYKIKVRNYEVKIWLSAYQIIFKIEKMMSKQTSPKELIDLIQRQLVSYVKNNKDERRYIVHKMLSKIVESFNIKTIKLNDWLNKFVMKYKSQFKGCQILNSKKSNDQHDEVIDEKINHKPTKMLDKKKRKKQEKKLNQKEKPKKIVDSVLLQRSNQVDIENYSISFRQKISNNISEEINRVFDSILKQKSQEFSLSYDIVKNIFKQHGHIDFQGKEKSNSITDKISNDLSKQIDAGKQKFDKNHIEVPTAHKTKMGESKKMLSNDDNQKIQTAQMNDSNETQEALSEEVLLQKLQQKVMNFIKLNLNCPARSLEKQTQSAMASLNFNNQLKSKVRERQLCLILKKNNLTIDDNRYLREIEKVGQSNKGKAKTRHISQKEQTMMKQE